MHPVHKATCGSTVIQHPYAGLSEDKFNRPQWGDPVVRSARVLKSRHSIRKNDGTFAVSQVTILMDGGVPVDERDLFESDASGLRRSILAIETGVLANGEEHHVRVKLHG